MITDTNTVYSIKMISGEEIVTKILSEDDNSYTLSKVLVAVPSPQGLQLISWLFTTNPMNDIVVSKNHCLTIGVSRDEVRDGYIETTTGIKPVTNKILYG